MKASTRTEFNEWRTAARTQRHKHTVLGYLWAGFGLWGVWDYIHRTGFHLPADGIAASIPVLFFISVLAMYQGEKNQAGQYRVEEKQQDAVEAEASDS